ncbi:PKD domain-containing protein [Methanosarcina horonobensis]|nr:PKD domain-containing protein [Methanosarcina horonobensis]
MLFLILTLPMASAANEEKVPFKINETQITTSGSAERPVIYKDMIVWQDYRYGNYGDGTFDGTYDVYVYNLSTSREIQITTPGSAATNPDIYGDRIVWSDDRNGNFRLEKSDIYMCSLSTSTETRITANESYSVSPAIYEDRIVWTEYNNVHMYNLSTQEGSQIVTSESMIFSPAIYGNNIVWEELLVSTDNGVSRDIYFYGFDTHKKTQITTGGSAGSPEIYGDRIVYEDWRDGHSNIYMYNTSTSSETQITTSGSASSPDIYDNRIVWLDGRNGDTDVYMYNLSTHREIRVTSSESSKEYPAIYGDRIVWEDTFNGTSNIYMSTFSGDESELKTPVVNFTSNITEGYAPLTVKFTDLSENATEWNWNFGDGTNSTRKNLEHTFSAAGYYRVTLNVSNAYGTDTKKIDINVRNNSQKIPCRFNFLIFEMLVLYLFKRSA